MDFKYVCNMLTYINYGKNNRSICNKIQWNNKIRYDKN